MRNRDRWGNFAADRAFAEQVRAIAPNSPAVTLLNRRFCGALTDEHAGAGVGG